MEMMFETGFLGTRAPYFMDIVTLVVALLPILVYGSILLARKKLYKLHSFMQNTIFIISVVVVGYFEYGARKSGGFSLFMEGSDVNYTYALIVLIAHIIIATLTLLHWVKLIIMANLQFKHKTLPGRNSTTHKLLAAKTFIGIVFTSVSGIWVYILLFIY
jgi:putative membrane protein